MPRRMCSTVRKPPQTMMFGSPRPVEPAAPTSLSVYWPAPMMGESPARPGIFQESPLVVVIEEISRSEEHTSELQSRENLVCRLLLEKKKVGERKGAAECDQF